MHLSPRRLLSKALPVLPTLFALIVASALFGLFVALQGKSVTEVGKLIYVGAFGSGYALQNTLTRAAPLMLTALCVALPARTGLAVIGGEGALALGGLAAAITPLWLPAMPPLLALALMACSGVLAGGIWVLFAGWLRQKRGVNETISSLLLSYIAVALFRHFVEGIFKDPGSLNKPSTKPLPDSLMIGSMLGIDVHWGLAWGVIACVVAYVLIRYSVIGFSMEIVGGNFRAAKLVGLPVNRIIFLACFLGGGAAGLAGMLEVAAVHGSANDALLAGYGYSGILVAFAARQNPLGIIVCSLLIGGIQSSGSLLQRRLDMPDAAVLVFQGLLFLNLLAWEAMSGRITKWRLSLDSHSRFMPNLTQEPHHA